MDLRSMPTSSVNFHFKILVSVKFCKSGNALIFQAVVSMTNFSHKNVSHRSLTFQEVCRPNLLKCFFNNYSTLTIYKIAESYFYIPQIFISDKVTDFQRMSLVDKQIGLISILNRKKVKIHGVKILDSFLSQIQENVGFNSSLHQTNSF